MENIRHTFLDEYGEAFSKGTRISSADSDFRFCVDTQLKRLKNKGLSMDISFRPRGRDPEGETRTSEWSDGRYYAKMNTGTCSFGQILRRGDERVFFKKIPAEVPVVVTDVLQNQHIEDDIYVCPNCGHPSRIRELVEGCSYCSTKFRMDELYPKVSNFNITRDVELSKREVIAQYLLPAICICAAAMLIISGISLIAGFGNGSTDIEDLLLSIILASPVYGAIYGGMFLLGCVIFETIKAAPITLAHNTHKIYEEEMKKHGQEFMTQYFIGKTVSKLKTVIFSDDPSVLPFYTGPALPPEMKDAVDVIYRGGLAFKDVKVTDGIAHVEADIYTEVLSDNNGRIKRKNRNFHVKMARSITCNTGFDFSINKLQCNSCGASFDAYKNKICPFCGNEYHMLDLDWIIESVSVD